MTTTELPAPTHYERLVAAAATTATARQHVADHAALKANVTALKSKAEDGELDDEGAAELVAKAEKVRIGEITAPRRQKALDDAQAAEVAVSLEVLADLAEKVAGLAKDAAQAADSLTAALVDPAAQAIRSDTAAGDDRDRGRCMVEQFMPGVHGAAVLADRIKSASTTTWGALHIPSEAAAIVATFDAELAAIRAGINGLLAIHKAAVKVFG